MNKGAQEPLIIVSGNGRDGKFHLKYKLISVELSMEGEETLNFQAIISGKFYLPKNLIIFDVTPQNVTGLSKSSVSPYKSGKLSTVSNYRNGVMKTKASWPEMVAFMQYLKAFVGDTSPPTKLDSTEAIPESEILGPFQFDGSLNWIPDKLPDLKHKYFQQWFDTFWEVLNEKIEISKGSKSKADTARELYEQYVKKALADGLQHKINKDVMDHCRLWPGKFGSSLDESFEKYFHNMDDWYQEQIDSFPDFGTKSEKSREKFFFSINATQNFQLGYLSEELRNKLHLWMQKESSYIDSCFAQFLSNHNKDWKNKINKALSFESKNSIAERYFMEVPNILVYKQSGVLSQDIIERFGLVAGLYNGYPDECFKIGWELGNSHYKKLSPQSGKEISAVELYAKWLIHELYLTYLGLTSREVNKEVEDTWNKLLTNYPSLKQKYKL